jgi:hypothetical protein
MSQCPECGRINYVEPAGYIALCGRRVSYADAPGVLYPNESQWKDRMEMLAKCKASASQESGDTP